MKLNLEPYIPRMNLINTYPEVTCYNPENFTGHQLFFLNFTDIRTGIWKLQLKGEYISNG